jgi:hypothetical protein
LGDKHQLLDLGLWYPDLRGFRILIMGILKRILAFILGIVFYPFISGYIMLENIGFFDRIKKYNWTAVITYTIIALMGYLWIIYVVKPLVLIISGNIID